MTLEDLLEHLRTVAVEFRREGRVCCAQLAEQYATRLAEAIEKERGMSALTEYPEIIQGKDAARFRKFVHESDPAKCWEWQSVRNHRGYGKFWLNGRTDLAHRVSYQISNGEIPAGLLIRHTCDNPPCVNPAHLLTGTVKENAEDAVERGKYRRGSENGRAKLTPDQVSEIKKSWAGGETQTSIARRFGVSKSAIQWILNGRNWASLSEGA